MSPEQTHPDFLNVGPFSKIIGAPLKDHLSSFSSKTQRQLTNVMDKTKDPEFLDWKWIKPIDLTKVAVDFKLNIYKKIKEELASLNLN